MNPVQAPPGKLGTCEYCGRAIRWVVTRKAKRMPLDPAPVTDGTVVIERDLDGSVYARVLRSGEATILERFNAHFASCNTARRCASDSLPRAIERTFEKHGASREAATRDCSGPGPCQERIPRDKLLCRYHWRQVPPDIQKAILRLSRPGQSWEPTTAGEIRPSLACRQAAEAALEAISRPSAVGGVA